VRLLLGSNCRVSDEFGYCKRWLYSWFDNYVQPCVDTQNCKQRIFLNNGVNERFRLFNLITIGSVEMPSAPQDGLIMYTKDNTQARSHPFWSILAGYLDDGVDDQIIECTDDDESAECFGTPKCDYSLDFDTLDAVLVTYRNYPVAAQKVKVINLKDVVTAAMTIITATQNSIFARELDILSGQWHGSANDIVQVVSMPVMMLQQAIEAMGETKALGTSQKAEDKKNLILEISSVVFIFIPFLDDIALEVLAAARIGTLIGNAGSLAITIQDVVSDAGSAPLAILGVFGGAGAILADVSNMAKLISIRRGVSDDMITGIGPTFRALNDDLRAIERLACKF
jgi:hypothetical protein